MANQTPKSDRSETQLRWLCCKRRTFTLKLFSKDSKEALGAHGNSTTWENQSFRLHHLLVWWLLWKTLQRPPMGQETAVCSLLLGTYARATWAPLILKAGMPRSLCPFLKDRIQAALKEENKYHLQISCLKAPLFRNLACLRTSSERKIYNHMSTWAHNLFIILGEILKTASTLQNQSIPGFGCRL